MRSLLVLGFLALCLAACDRSSPDTVDTPDTELLTEAQALTIAHQIASGKGHDMSRYRLDPFPTRLSEDRQEFGFYFHCAPTPAPPGCGFSVHIDRQSGSATYAPGQ